MASIQPAHTQLCYSLANAGNYIDIAKDLSVLNRRLYRQGMVYAIRGITVFFDAAGDADYYNKTITITARTVPNTWVTHNAWTKGFRIWKQQQNDARKLITGIKPRWEDFKVAMDSAQVQLDSGSGDGANAAVNLSVRDGTLGAVIAPDEWQYSRIVWEDDDEAREPLLHMMGEVTSDTVTVYAGLIENYGDSRAQPGTSEPSHDADASINLYAKMVQMGEVAGVLIDNMEVDNDQAPYDVDAYIGGAAESPTPLVVGYTACNASSPVGRMPGFVAPCGLLHVTADGWRDPLAAASDPGDLANTGLVDSSVTPKIIVDVAVGPYRGVLAAPMGQ